MNKCFWLLVLSACIVLQSARADSPAGDGINRLSADGEREGWWCDSSAWWRDCCFFRRGRVSGVYLQVGYGGDVIVMGDERAEKDWCYVDGWLWTDVAVCRDTIVSGSFRTRSVGGGYEALAVAFYDDGSVKSEEMIYYEHPMVDVGTYGHCSYYYESGFLKDSNGVLQCKELYGGSGELVEVVEYKDGTNDLCRREAQRG